MNMIQRVILAEYEKIVGNAIQKARPNHNDGKALSPNLAPQCGENISLRKEPRFWPAL